MLTGDVEKQQIITKESRTKDENEQLVINSLHLRKTKKQIQLGSVMKDFCLEIPVVKSIAL